MSEERQVTGDMGDMYRNSQGDSTKILSYVNFIIIGVPRGSCSLYSYGHLVTYCHLGNRGKIEINHVKVSTQFQGSQYFGAILSYENIKKCMWFQIMQMSPQKISL